jgi:sec-independent protein translocase protein TatA
MGRIGTPEIILIVLVIVLLFGASRIPQLMRSLGSGVREFKKGAKGEVDDDDTKQGKTPDSEKPTDDRNK